MTLTEKQEDHCRGQTGKLAITPHSEDGPLPTLQLPASCRQEFLMPARKFREALAVAKKIGAAAHAPVAREASACGCYGILRRHTETLGVLVPLVVLVRQPARRSSA